MFAIALLAVIGGSFVAIDRMMGPLSGEGGVFIGGVVAATAGPVLITAIFLPQYARLSIFLLFSCSLMLISYRVAAGFAANEPALGIFLGVVMFIWMWLTFGCCWYFFTSTALFGD